MQRYQPQWTCLTNTFARLSTTSKIPNSQQPYWRFTYSHTVKKYDGKFQRAEQYRIIFRCIAPSDSMVHRNEAGRYATEPLTTRDQVELTNSNWDMNICRKPWLTVVVQATDRDQEQEWTAASKTGERGLDVCLTSASWLQDGQAIKLVDWLVV